MCDIPTQIHTIHVCIRVRLRISIFLDNVPSPKDSLVLLKLLNYTENNSNYLVIRVHYMAPIILSLISFAVYCHVCVLVLKIVNWIDYDAELSFKCFHALVDRVLYCVCIGACIFFYIGQLERCHRFHCLIIYIEQFKHFDT